jgi:hypothetical protein
MDGDQGYIRAQGYSQPAWSAEEAADRVADMKAEMDAWCRRMPLLLNRMRSIREAVGQGLVFVDTVSCAKPVTHGEGDAS